MKIRRPKTKTDQSSEHFLANLGARLQDVRLLRGATQLDLADKMGVGQTALSHMEKRDDLLLSTVASVIESLGGTLHVAAKFPDSDPIMLVGGGLWRSSEVKVHPASTERSPDQLLLPDILGPEQVQASRDVVFSIHPTHAENIFAGRKTVELRRRFTDSVTPGTLALIYTTSPTSALTGFARIRAVERLNLSDLWETHSEAACLQRSDFEAYFSGVDRGYAIMLASAKSLPRPVGLSELRERFGFEPPQSFQYASPQMCGLVENG